MSPEDFRAFLSNAKQDYKKIGYIECPAFGGEKVYFTSAGFIHLIRKDKILRPMKEQIRRLSLMKMVNDIVANNQKFSEHTLLNNKKPPAQFWSLVIDNNDLYVKVVIRQIGNGNKHFFSVMDKTK